MNLAFITKRYGRIGGTERDLHELTVRLVARGHDVHIYCTEVRMEAPHGIKVHRVPVIGFGRLARFLSIAWLGPRRARRNGHDLVISYERVFRQDIARCGGGTHRVFLQRMAKKSSPLTRLFRALDPYHKLVKFTEKRQFTAGNFRRAHAVSELVKQELIDIYGVDDSSIDVIYCGVDTDIFRPENRRTDGATVREELGIPADDTVALFLGNGFKRKGLDAFLAGIGATDTVHGLVVGTDSQIANYRNLARKLGIEARVHFVGQQSETSRYYAAANLFVLPSVQEAFGIVVLEAMATGLPCLVSSRAGAAEVLPESMARFLMQDPHDPTEMATKIKEVLEPATHTRLAEDSRNAAMNFSLEEHARVSEKLYRSMCG